MTFTKRHEDELQEIKALFSELGRRASEVQERLGRLNEVQMSQLGGVAKPGRLPSARRGDDPLIAFVHIPKTAGATVTGMFAAAYSKAAVRDAGNYPKNPDYTTRKFSRQKKQIGRVLAGHVPYSVFREHLPDDTRYVTFLRDPVDRVISHYFRHIHGPDLSAAKRSELRARGKETASSLEEAMVEMRLPQLNNFATRFLCESTSPMGELPSDALESAKANLREFAFVGIQERFEESIVLLQRTFDLGIVPYLNRHVSSEGGRPAVEEIPDDQRSLLLDHNRLDAELYGFAVGLFEKAVAGVDQNFREDVASLTALTAAANEQALREAREWLDRELPLGATRDYAELRAAAKAAGVPKPALNEVLRVSSMRMFPEGGDRKVVLRTEEAPRQRSRAGGQAGRQMVVTTQDGSTRVITR